MQAHTIQWGASGSALMLCAGQALHNNAQALLWLQLEGGAVRAFRLPAKVGHAAELEALAEQCADDAGGKVLEFALQSAPKARPSGQAHALYAAPVSPIANAAAWTASARWLAWSTYTGAVADATFADDTHCLPDLESDSGAALLRWSQMLDADSLRVLSTIAGDRVYASCRNYTRLMLATPTVRRNRLQALERYPNQLAHVLISPHHGYDLHGGSAHAWRLHAQTLQTAVDEGGNLLEALAQSCQVDKSVFKAPALHENWPTLALSRANLLQVLQGMPPTVRPLGSAALVQAQALWQWLRRHDLTDADTLRAVGSGFLRKGFAPVLAKLQQWEVEGTFSWTDIDDYVRQLHLWEDQRNVPQNGEAPPQRSVLRAWLRDRGLWDLHKASNRWHEALPDLLTQRRHDALQLADTLQTPVRQLHLELPSDLWQAQLLATVDALRVEGSEMKHCVATYWSECVEQGSRIFSVRALAGPTAQDASNTALTLRVTAQYQLQRVQADYVYVLAQVRGYRNRPPDATALAATGQLCDALNAPHSADMRQALGRELQALQQRRQVVDHQHANGYWGAAPMLDATSLAYLSQLT